MQSLGDSAYIKLRKIADERDITVQELIRAIVIPDWMKMMEKYNAGERQSDRHRRLIARSPKARTAAPVPGPKLKRKQ